MKRNRQTGMSLRYKLLMVVLAVLTVSMSTFFLLQYRQTRRDLINRLGLSATPLSDVINSSLTHAMQTRDLEDLRGIVNNVSKQKGVERVMVVDKDGRIQVSPYPEDVGRLIDMADPTCQACHRVEPQQRSNTVVYTARSGARIFRNVRPIVNEPQCHRCHEPSRKINGVLISDFSMAGVEQELADRFRTMVLSLIVTLLVTAGTITFLMNRLVIARLQQLLKATRSLGRGNLAQRVAEKGGDEIAELASSFNEMVENLRRSREVRERKELIENVLNAVKESIIVLDPQGRIISLSRGSQQIFGYCPQEVCGLEYAGLGEARRRIWQQATAEGRVDVETKIERSEGKLLPARVRVIPLRNEHRELLGYVEVTYDLTEERARQQLQQRLAESEKLARIGLVASGVAHEINNPMTSIAAYSEALIEKVGQMPDGELCRLDPSSRLPEYLKVIHEEAFRCKAITQNLLDYARPRQLQVRPTSVNDLVESALGLEGGTMETQGVKPVTDLAADAPHILVDPDQLRQALLNLIRNAIDAMPEGGQLTVATKCRDRKLVISVNDTGCGISEEHLPKLFDPFFSTKHEGQGTGLGLSLCEKVIQKHGGRISVESEVGVGTTFCLHLPIEQSSEEDQE